MARPARCSQRSVRVENLHPNSELSVLPVSIDKNNEIDALISLRRRPRGPLLLQDWREAFFMLLKVV